MPGDRVGDDSDRQGIHFPPPCVIEPVARLQYRTDPIARIWRQIRMLQMHLFHCCMHSVNAPCRWRKAHATAPITIHKLPNS
jgi:hypothetical protein